MREAALALVAIAVTAVPGLVRIQDAEAISGTTSGGGDLERLATLGLPASWTPGNGDTLIVDPVARRAYLSDNESSRAASDCDAALGGKQIRVYDLDTRACSAIDVAEVFGSSSSQLQPPHAFDDEKGLAFLVDNTSTIHVVKRDDLTEKVTSFPGPVALDQTSSSLGQTGAPGGLAFDQPERVLFATTGGPAATHSFAVAAYDPDTGEQYWQLDLRQYCAGVFATYGHPNVLGVAKDRRFLYTVCAQQQPWKPTDDNPPGAVVRIDLTRGSGTPQLTRAPDATSAVDVFPGFLPGGGGAAHSSFWVPGLDRIVSVSSTEGGRGQAATVFDGLTGSFVAAPTMLQPAASAVIYDSQPAVAVDPVAGRLYVQDVAQATGECKEVVGNDFGVADLVGTGEDVTARTFDSGDLGLNGDNLGVDFDPVTRTFWMVNHPMQTEDGQGARSCRPAKGTPQLVVYRDTLSLPVPPTPRDPDASTANLPEDTGKTGANASADASAYGASYQFAPSGFEGALTNINVAAFGTGSCDPRTFYAIGYPTTVGGLAQIPAEGYETLREATDDGVGLPGSGSLPFGLGNGPVGSTWDSTVDQVNPPLRDLTGGNGGVLPEYPSVLSSEAPATPPILPPQWGAACHPGRRAMTFAEVPQVTLDSAEVLARAVPMDVDDTSDQDVVKATEANHPGPYVNGVVETADEQADELTSGVAPDAIGDPQPCSQSQNEDTGNLDDSCAPWGTSEAGPYLAGQHLPFDAAACTDASGTPARFTTHQRAYLGQQDPFVSEDEDGNVSDRDPLASHGPNEATVTCDFTVPSATGTATTNNDPGSAIASQSARAWTSVTRTAEDGSVATAHSVVDGIDALGVLRIGRLESHVTVSAHGRPGTTVVDYECYATNVVIAPPGGEPTAIPGRSTCQALHDQLVPLNRQTSGLFRIDFPEAPTWSDVEGGRAAELLVVAQESPGGYLAQLQTSRARQLGSTYMLSDTSIEHPALEITFYADSAAARDRFVVRFAGVAASARYGIFELPSFGCFLCGGSAQPTHASPGTFAPRGVPSAAVAGTEARTVIDPASSTRPTPDPGGGGLSALWKQFMDGLRWLWQHPGAIAALLAAWALLLSPWFVLSRRRALAQVIEGVV